MLPIRAILAAVIVAICWGGNYTASKFALAELPPFCMLLARFTLCCLVLLPFVIGKKIPNLREMTVLSLLLIVLQFALVFPALKMGLNITSSIIAAQLGIPFSCILAAIFFKDFLGPWRSFGLMVAFLGVMMVAGTPNAAEHWLPFLLTVIGAAGWSGANIYLKTIAQPPTAVMLFWTALVSLPAFLILTVLFEQNQIASLQAAQWPALAGIVYGVLFASVIGYGLWSWLVRAYPVSQVMPFGLLMPVAGIAIGSTVFDEPLSSRTMIGGALAMAGVAIITIRRPKLAELER